MTDLNQIVDVRPVFTAANLELEFEYSAALTQRLAAVTRLHQAECQRLTGTDATADEVLLAWSNANVLQASVSRTLLRQARRFKDAGPRVVQLIRAVDAALA